MAPPLFADLDRATRRRLVWGTLGRIGRTTALLLVAYWVLPFAGRGTGVTALWLVAGVAVVMVVLGWQVRRILTADYPQLRAVEAAATAAPLLLVVFASTYLSLSDALPGTFSEPLSHASALYFAMTVLSTVGFGDIVARTDAARLVVTLQMILDLTLIGIALRLLARAASVGVDRRRGDGPPPG